MEGVLVGLQVVGYRVGLDNGLLVGIIEGTLVVGIRVGIAEG